MAKINPPIKTRTIGNFPAIVTDNIARNTDQLEGTVTLANGTLKNVRWNRGGICRDNPDAFNLNMNEAKHKPLLKSITRRDPA